MNKKGQTMGLAIITAIGVFIIGLMFVNFFMPEVTTARIDLNCSSADTIHSGNKILCLGIDLVVPLVIWGVISLAIGLITARVVF